MSKTTKPLKGSQLKEFRHGVSLLKKKGVISARVDARTQKPTKYMLAKVRRNKDLIDNNDFAPVKVSAKYRDLYKSAGYTVRDNRVIVANEPGVKKSVKSGLLTSVTKLKNGQIEEIHLPFSFRNFNQIYKHADALDKLKAPGELFTFTYKGGFSNAAFQDMRSLFDYMMHYPEFDEEDPDYYDPEGGMQFISIYRVSDVKAWSDKRPKKRISPEARARRSQRRRARRDRVEAVYPQKKVYRLKREAERNAAKKARRTPAEHEALKERDRIRKRAERAKYREIVEEVKKLDKRNRKARQARVLKVIKEGRTKIEG